MSFGRESLGHGRDNAGLECIIQLMIDCLWFDVKWTKSGAILAIPKDINHSPKIIKLWPSSTDESWQEIKKKSNLTFKELILQLIRHHCNQFLYRLRYEHTNAYRRFEA